MPQISPLSWFYISFFFIFLFFVFLVSVWWLKVNYLILFNNKNGNKFLKISSDLFFGLVFFWMW